MVRLGQSYPQLEGYYPYPKPLINSRLLSVQQLCGIYSPFTIEANYNREMPYYNIPHTICHELSHLKGFMREDEANFIGYLACIGSDSPDFRRPPRTWPGTTSSGSALKDLWQKPPPR